MNLIHLRYALAIEDTGSVTQAAQRLFVAQPNISRAIRELEADIGITLFRRTATGMVPTEEGKIFLLQARDIVRQLDALDRTYHGSGERRQYFAVCGHGASYIARAFTAFVKDNAVSQPFAYNFWAATSNMVTTYVAHGDSDVGVIRFAANMEARVRQWLSARGLGMNILFSTPQQLLVSESSPLAALPAVGEADLAGYVQVTCNTRLHIDENRMLPEQHVSVGDRGSRAMLLKTVPHTFAMTTQEESGDMEEGLVQRPFSKKQTPLKDAVVFRKKYTYSELDKAFLASLHRVISAYL
ncbi:MAG: LysR family transcriptional regulator [Clostridia bacterium]|nr:LysR family transcriptional regulator [Clostridia bacterium]